MRVVVLGATGFIGRALVLALLGRGHRVCALARSVDHARALLPVGVDVVPVADAAAPIADADAVVNLAGESLAGKRWTRKRKRVLVASRIESTRRLVEAIARRERELPVFVSTSAVGWYGDRGDEQLDERSAPGTGFLAELCRDWEAAASAARAKRIVRPRLGVVLGREGGALRPLLRVTRLGLGGPLGNGRQWLPWVHLEDAVAAITWMLESEVRGPVVVAHAIRQADLARVLGDALDRRAIVRTPAFALRLALGEQATALLSSQRVKPRVLDEAGFRFRFPTIDHALDDLVDDAVTIDGTDDGYILSAHSRLEAPLDDVFAFFSSPANLAALTPPSLAFEIVNMPDAPLEDGATIDYRLRVAGVPLAWRTRIETWEPGVRFVDSQERGPYRLWHHEHRFRAENGATIMEDVVRYRPPLGALGGWVVKPMLRRIFAFRGDAIRLRFNARA